MAREVKTDQDYKSKLLKLIPSEIVAAYILIEDIIPGDYKNWGSLITALLSSQGRNGLVIYAI